MTATRHPGPTESQFQAAVVDLAHLTGWRTNHVFRSASTRAGGGWRTATTTVGWPDLTLWRPGQLLMVEIKTDRGRLTAEQRDVLASLRAAGVDTSLTPAGDLGTGPQSRTLRPPYANGFPTTTYV